MVVGRTNTSEERTILLATTAKDGYAEDYVLFVGAHDGKVLKQTTDGVDGVHAVGTVRFPTGGMIGTIEAGNGLVGTGLNGVVGYVHAKPRDTAEEQRTQAGVFGSGGASPGVFGRGANGVVGYSGIVPRDMTWEAASGSGVAGASDAIGVRGMGDAGGVQGTSVRSFGVEGVGATGVLGRSTDGIGVTAQCGSGPGVLSTSDSANALVLEAPKRAHAWFVPTEVDPPTGPVVPITPWGFNLIDGENQNPLRKDGRAGELAVLKDHQGKATLWFCVSDSTERSHWAQVMLGPEFEGTAEP